MSETIEYTSVTALTGLLPKHLTTWAANAAARAAFYDQDQYKHLPTKEERYDWCRNAHERIKDNAADLGTEVHKFVEAHNLGKPTPTWPLPVRARMQHFEQFVKDWQPKVEAAEVKVYHRNDRGMSRIRGSIDFNYAGTCDMIAEIDGKMSVIDIKTGKNVWPEAGIQLNLYAYADFLVADPFHPGAVQITPKRGRRHYEWHGPAKDEEPMPDIEQGYVLHLTDNGYALHPVPITDEMYEMGLSLFSVLRWESDLKKRAVGKPLLTSPGIVDTLDQIIKEFGATEEAA